jgi:hypothetical protein
LDKIGLCNDTREGIDRKQKRRKHSGERSLQKADDEIYPISKGGGRGNVHHNNAKESSVMEKFPGLNQSSVFNDKIFFFI